jgi:hypothetical protein
VAGIGKVSAISSREEIKMTAKLLELDTPFDGPVYVNPEHVQFVD